MIRAMSATATHAIRSVGDIFCIWETLPEMAADVDESHWTVSKWKQRDSIPQEYWAAVVDAAAKKGRKLSADDLLRMHGSAVSRRANRMASRK